MSDRKVKIGRILSFLFSAASILIFASIALSAFWPNGQSSVLSSMKTMRLQEKGAALSESEAAALERKLENNENDLDARRKLIAYYGTRADDDETAAANAQQHGFWIIENKPDVIDYWVMSFYRFFSKHNHPEEYERAKTMWLAHIERDPENLVLLENASHFLEWGDPERSTELLQKLHELDSKNPEWPERIAEDIFEEWMFQDEAAIGQGEEERISKAELEKAIRYYEAAHRLTLAGGDRNIAGQAAGIYERIVEGVAKKILPGLVPGVAFGEEFRIQMAYLAVEVGDYEKAESLAQELLESEGPAWSTHNMIYTRHNVLGLIAIDHDDVAEAKEHLLLSIDSLNPRHIFLFPPALQLPRELGERGELETVQKYLEFFEATGHGQPPQLRYWLRDLRAGKKPDFTGEAYLDEIMKDYEQLGSSEEL
jgi:hypothetical protein